MSDDLFPEATWISLDEASQILDVPVNKVRQLIAEGAIASLRVGTPPAPRIPAEFFQDGEIVKNLGGTLTVLADSGFARRSWPRSATSRASSIFLGRS